MKKATKNTLTVIGFTIGLIVGIAISSTIVQQLFYLYQSI